jgi:hypothetical protein
MEGDSAAREDPPALGGRLVERSVASRLVVFIGRRRTRLHTTALELEPDIPGSRRKAPEMRARGLDACCVEAEYNLGGERGHRRSILPDRAMKAKLPPESNGGLTRIKAVLAMDERDASALAWEWLVSYAYCHPWRMRVAIALIAAPIPLVFWFAFESKIPAVAYTAVTLGLVVSVRGIATRHMAGVRQRPDDQRLG